MDNAGIELGRVAFLTKAGHFGGVERAGCPAPGIAGEDLPRLAALLSRTLDRAVEPASNTRVETDPCTSLGTRLEWSAGLVHSACLTRPAKGELVATGAATLTVVESDDRRKAVLRRRLLDDRDRSAPICCKEAHGDWLEGKGRTE